MNPALVIGSHSPWERGKWNPFEQKKRKIRTVVLIEPFEHFTSPRLFRRALSLSSRFRRSLEIHVLHSNIYLSA